MLKGKHLFLAPIAAGILLVIGMVLLWPAPAVNAQCGSQASSCKNCHETQGKKPVNKDGTPWHQAHAFGDFCYLCHAGNNQSMDETQAHTGMVDPLSDIQVSCGSCHPTDLQARAQVFADKLGVKLGTENASAAQPTQAGTGQTAAPASAGGAVAPAAAGAVSSSMCPTQIDVNDPDLVDYIQHYDQVVLGKKPVNIGNIILIVLIGAMLVGGGGLVATNEKLVKVTFGETKKVEGEYPAELVDMLPAMTNLKPGSRKSLKNILENPEKTEKVLYLIDAVVSEEKSEE
jgi:hypothetical protein